MVMQVYYSNAEKRIACIFRVNSYCLIVVSKRLYIVLKFLKIKMSELLVDSEIIRIDFDCFLKIDNGLFKLF